MPIAILDFYNHDIGLKILFPEADYFAIEEEVDRARLNLKYNITSTKPDKDVVFNHIDTLFVIAPLYDAVKIYNGKEKPVFYLEKTARKLKDTVQLIEKHKFARVCFFDNYDYDYDPNIIFEEYPTFVNDHNIYFFKRNYSKEKSYKPNVFSFPYIIFGHQCNIDMLLSKTDTAEVDIIPRLFFSGTSFHHVDKFYNVDRNRKMLFNKICEKMNIYNPGRINHDLFMKEMRTSKYCLDLLGVGDPNIRTFEILSVGSSLRIGQRSDLKWPFPDNFCEETIFDDDNDLLEKIKTLESDPELFTKCLQKQNDIVDTYMNANYLRQYILGIIS